MRTLHLLIAAGVGFGLAACSNSNPAPVATPDTTSPSASSFVQNRDVDASGRVVDVTFDEELDASSAETSDNYSFSGGIDVLSAMLLPAGDTVRLSLTAAAVPGTNAISVTDGVTDLAGNGANEVVDAAITSTDTERPAASGVAATTVTGPDNDSFVVTFDDDMIASDVESDGNWTVESPLGSTFDVTGASISYDAATRMATLVLDASADRNLQTFDDLHVSVSGMTDLGGNAVTATTIGVDAVSDTIEGDDMPPQVVALAVGATGDLNVRFDEHARFLETADLIASVPVSGTRFVLRDDSDPGQAAAGTLALSGRPNDGDGVVLSDGSDSETFEFDWGAQGSFALSGQPLDGDSVTIDDGVSSVTFEFDNDFFFAGTPVTIGLTVPDTISNLLTAINAEPFFIVTAYAGLTSSDLVLVNDGIDTDGNVPIVNFDTALVQSISGMSGAGVAPGAFPVAVTYDDDAATVTSWRIEIDFAGLDLFTSAGATSTDFVVENSFAGSAGNVAITETDTAGVISFTGMGGGIDPATLTYEPTSSVASDGGLGVLVTFPVTPAVGDDVLLYGVSDLAGNQTAPLQSEPVIALDSNTPALSPTNSIVRADPGERNDSVLVKFDRPMQPFDLLDPANYVLDPGAPIDLSGAEFEFDGVDEVTITFDEAAGHNVQVADTYDLSINDVSSAQGVGRTTVDTELDIAPTGDFASPSIAINDARIDPSSSMSLLVTFSEAADRASAETASNYELEGTEASAASLIHPCVVRVDFAVEPIAGEAFMVRAAAVTDLAGNSSSSEVNLSVVAADADAPSVTFVSATAVENDANDVIEITFDEQLELLSATMAENYAVINGTPLDITGSELSYDSTNRRVTIMLPSGVHLDPAFGIDVTPSNVMDVPGNPIVPLTTAGFVGGDFDDPDFDYAFVNFREDAGGAVVDVRFDEDVDASLATDSANWASSGAQVVTGVVQLNSQLFRVTLDAPLGATETLTASNQEDLARNAAAPLVIDPAE